MRNKLTRLQRRITSFLMAMVMTLSLVVGVSTTAHAENNSQDRQQALADYEEAHDDAGGLLSVLSRLSGEADYASLYNRYCQDISVNNITTPENASYDELVTATENLIDAFQHAENAAWYIDTKNEVNTFIDSIAHNCIKGAAVGEREKYKQHDTFLLDDPYSNSKVEIEASIGLWNTIKRHATEALKTVDELKKLPKAADVTLADKKVIEATKMLYEEIPEVYAEAINESEANYVTNLKAAVNKIKELEEKKAAEEAAKKQAEEAAKKAAEEAAKKAAEEAAAKKAAEEAAAKKAVEEAAKKNAKIEVPNWTVYKGNAVAVDKNGKVVKKTGIATWRGYNLLIANGVLYKKPVFFLDKSDGKYKYFVNGIQAKTGDTFIPYAGKLIHVTNGVVNQTDGFVRYNGKFVYSYHGMAATSFTGTIKYKGYKIKITKGVYTGISR